MPEAPMAQLSKPLRMCILGGGGYLGQTLAKVLQSECAHFTVLFDVNFTEFSHIQLEEELTLRIRASIYDDMDQLLAALEGCDACFHIAGYGMSGGPSLDRQKCMDVNVGGTENVIEACKRMGVARLIFTSSVSVIFDGQNELHMADEESTPYVTKFGNPYVEAKCLAEQILLRTNNPPQLATCAIRLRGIYGPGELRSVQRCVNLCLCGVVKCTFAKSEDPLTQYSSVENSVNALMLVEKSLRNVDSPAAGNKYHIVDGGPPVHPWAFWYPLIAALGCPLPFFRVPYSIIVALAFLFEQLYKLFGVEPLFTRYEVALLAITNTFSIRRAQQDFGYSPVRSHDLRATIQFCQQQLSEKNEQKGLRKRRDLGASSRRMLVAGCWLFDGFTGLLGLSKCAFLLFLLFFASSLFLPVEALGSGWNCLGAALRRLMQSIGTTFFSCC